MPLVTTKEMFEKSMEEGFAIGAFNINNMEIIQGIIDAAQKQNSPVILQASSGAIKYARNGRSSSRGNKYSNSNTFRPWSRF
jgi:fructose-bisphosphate aldolase class II